MIISLDLLNTCSSRFAVNASQGISQAPDCLAPMRG